MRSLLVCLMVSSSLAMARPTRTPVPYELDGTQFEGVLIHDAAAKKPLPGLLLVPNWLGINEANLAQATEIAAQGYVVFVADLYGKASRPKNQAEAGKAAGAVKGDRAVMRARTARALETFRAQARVARVDLARVGAIGFCFGGTAVLELAKSGANIAGVVSFHGGLDAKVPTEKRPAAKILALHGADDPTVPAADLQAFAEDLRRSGADWTLVQFGGAVHSFTDPGANTPGRSMYDAKTAERAFQMMRNFFAESFDA